MTDIYEYLHWALIESDAQAHICTANVAAESLLNSSRERLQGQPLEKALYLEARSWLDLLAQSRHNPIIIRDGTLHLPKVRTTIRVDLAIHSIPDGRHIISIDPISRAIAIANTAERQRQAEHNRLIIKNLAHEIRNPLAGIRGAAQRLGEQAGVGQQPYIDLIINQTDRLNRLLTTLTGASRPNLQWHNIHRICEETLALFGAQTDNQALSIRRYYDTSLPDIAVDDGQIQQVLLNLLQNAAKASDYQGEIIVRTAIVHQYTLNGHCHRQVLAVSIEDHGCGIPEELHVAIFQPMISHFRDGSGLGLAIVQNIIHRHGGAVEVDSCPGHTRFTLILPYQREAA